MTSRPCPKCGYKPTPKLLRRVIRLRVLVGNKGWVPDQKHSWWLGAAAYARSKTGMRNLDPANLLPWESEP